MQIPIRGKGGLTILIGLAGFFLQIVFKGYFLVIAAALNFALGWYLNKPLREAGAAPEMQHSVGGIPMQWISIVFLLAAVLLRG